MCLSWNKIKRRVIHFCKYGSSYEKDREEWVKSILGPPSKDEIIMSENSPLTKPKINPPLMEVVWEAKDATAEI